MKKLLFTIAIGGLISVTSCAKGECECTMNGETTTITKDDLDNETSVEEACTATDALLTTPSECHMI